MKFLHYIQCEYSYREYIPEEESDTRKSIMPQTNNEPAIESFLPLTPAEFEILLALVDGDLHGYAIMQEVTGRTLGSVKLLPGTLYRALTRMVEKSLIRHVGQPNSVDSDDERRRYYNLTALGGKVLKAEAERLSNQVKAAKAKNLIAKPNRT